MATIIKLIGLVMALGLCAWLWMEAAKDAEERRTTTTETATTETTSTGETGTGEGAMTKEGTEGEGEDLAEVVEPTCTITASLDVPARKRNGQPIEAPKKAWVLDDGSIIYLGTFAIDADGHPRAYHPDGSSGLDHLANAGGPGNWWALATDAPNCARTGNPIVQDADDPAPGFYVTMTTMTDPAISDCKKQRRYVNSGEISFVALSSRIQKFDHGGSAQSLAYVRNLEAGTESFGVFSDVGPTHGIGEGSMKLAENLGYSSNPKAGGTMTRQNLFILFDDTLGFPGSDQEVQTAGAAAYQAWGGEPRAALCEAALIEKRDQASDDIY